MDFEKASCSQLEVVFSLGLTVYMMVCSCSQLMKSVTFLVYDISLIFSVLYVSHMFHEKRLLTKSPYLTRAHIRLLFYLANMLHVLFCMSCSTWFYMTSCVRH